jgi:hypothetical protein
MELFNQNTIHHFNHQNILLLLPNKNRLNIKGDWNIVKMFMFIKENKEQLQKNQKASQLLLLAVKMKHKIVTCN